MRSILEVALNILAAAEAASAEGVQHEVRAAELRTHIAAVERISVRGLSRLVPAAPVLKHIQEIPVLHVVGLQIDGLPRRLHGRHIVSSPELAWAL